jgi:hypothetical protein
VSRKSISAQKAIISPRSAYEAAVKIHAAGPDSRERLARRLSGRPPFLRHKNSHIADGNPHRVGGN